MMHFLKGMPRAQEAGNGSFYRRRTSPAAHAHRAFQMKGNGGWVMRVLCVRILQETKALHFEPHPPAGRRGHKGSSDSRSRSPWRHSDHPGCAAVTIHPASASAHPDKSSSGWHPVHALRRAVQNKYRRWRYPAIHSRHRPGRAGSAGGERRKTAYPVVRSLRPA